jgi:inner membrane protein YidH
VGCANVSDHQANERTFLAWLRTAIALMGFGFVVANLGTYELGRWPMWIASASLTAVGALLVIYLFETTRR